MAREAGISDTVMRGGDVEKLTGRFSSIAKSPPSPLPAHTYLPRIEKHGEMSIETVDALELYGNALVRNAVSKSAVLGGEAAASKVPTAEGGSSVVPWVFPTPALSLSLCLVLLFSFRFPCSIQA